MSAEASHCTSYPKVTVIQGINRWPFPVVIVENESASISWPQHVNSVNFDYVRITTYCHISKLIKVRFFHNISHFIWLPLTGCSYKAHYCLVTLRRHESRLICSEFLPHKKHYWLMITNQCSHVRIKCKITIQPQTRKCHHDVLV